MPSTFEIRHAIDSFVGDLDRSEDEVCEGLLAIRDHLDGYVTVMQPPQDEVDTLPAATR